MTIPLTAPSSVRRSKKRCAQYAAVHANLVETTTCTKEQLAALEADPIWEEIEMEVIRDFWRYTAGDIV